MDNTTRDPRIDPQPGDVVASNNNRERFAVFARDVSNVSYFHVSADGRITPECIAVAMWQAGASTDTVTHVAGMRVSE